MATKPKTRKTSAAKRATPKAAMKQAPREPKREVSGNCGLIARWHFLEAEEVYRAEISPAEESDAALCKHQREQDEIETKLSRSIPQDFRDVRELLEFAADMIKMMLGNILESLPEIFPVKQRPHATPAWRRCDALSTL